MTEPLPAKFFEEPVVAELERSRDKSRHRRRIPYDCYNAIVDSKGPESVVCKKGHRLGGVRTLSLPLVSVLRGRSNMMCRSCFDYDDGGENSG